MSPMLSRVPGPSLVDWVKLAEPHKERLGIALILALAAHVGVGLVALTEASAPAPLAPPVDVEFAMPEPPPPAPEPLTEPPAEAAPPKLATAKLAPPPAARAGAVLTAKPDPTAAEPAEPFDFTSDPNSAVYGSGVVAVGGTASHGLSGAQLGGRGSVPTTAPPLGDGLTAASDLSQRPRLRVEDPCRGFFPNSAIDDVAVASVRVVIGKHGNVMGADLISESPKGQGFGAAAKRCMLAQTFRPALDQKGQPAATALAVNVRFSR